MQWLIIKISSPDATTAEYAFLDKDSEQNQFSRSGWQQLQELSNNRRVILLIPTEDVGLHHVDLPSASHKQLSKAIPFALEDAIAEDIDELHFSFHRESADKDINVAAISEQRLQQWLDQIEDKGIKPHFILPDVFMLPIAVNTSALSIFENRALYRQDTFSGSSFSSDLLPILLPSFFMDKADGETEEEQTLRVDKPDTLTLDIPEHIALQADSSLHNTCHSSLLSALPLNLLNNFGNTGQTALLEQLSRWKIPAILAAVTGSLWIATTGFQNYQLNQHLNQLNDTIVSVYKDTLPGARVDSDYRINHQVIEEKLNALGVEATQDKTSMLELLAIITPQIKKHKDIDLKKLSVNKNTISLSVTATSEDKLEQLKSAINNSGAHAALKSPSVSSNKATAIISIKKEKP